jgi:hypothetical protein
LAKAAAITNKSETISEVPTSGSAEPKPARKDSARIARQIYQTAKDELEGNLERFVERSSMEEKRFINAVLVDWGSINFGRPRDLGEYEVPIYSAVQLNIDGLHCLAIPDDDMIPRIEEFIAALERKSWRAKHRSDWPNKESSAAIRDRFAHSFRTDVEMFAREAGLPSLRFMRDILVRWSEIAHDPEGIKVLNALAAAVEMELNALRADTAATAA